MRHPASYFVHVMSCWSLNHDQHHLDQQTSQHHQETRQDLRKAFRKSRRQCLRKGFRQGPRFLTSRPGMFREPSTGKKTCPTQPRRRRIPSSQGRSPNSGFPAEALKRPENFNSRNGYDKPILTRNPFSGGTGTPYPRTFRHRLCLNPLHEYRDLIARKTPVAELLSEHCYTGKCSTSHVLDPRDSWERPW